MLTINFSHFRFAAEKSSPLTILDLGCGEGRHAIGAYWHLQNCDIVGVDIGQQELKIANTKFLDFSREVVKPNNVFFIAADGLDLPFAQHTFDIIICSEVLEHIINYQGMLKEIQRLIKPGGQIAISVPRFWPEKICWWLSRDYHSNPGGHIRIFRQQELLQQLQVLGFGLQHKHYAHSLHSLYWWLRCLFWRSGEHHPLCKIYHQFLVWDLMQKPRLTRWLDAMLNPLMGKSLVLYWQAPR